MPKVDRHNRRTVTFKGDATEHDKLKDVVWHAQQKGHAVNMTSALSFGMKLATVKLAARIGFKSTDEVPPRDGNLKNGRPRE